MGLSTGKLPKQPVVVTTGASSGIGREAALEFAARDARLVLAARNEEALESLVSEVDRLGGQAEAVICDVSEFFPGTGGGRQGGRTVRAD